MTIRAVDHVNIRARRDVLDTLQAFYCDVLGLVTGPRPAFPRFGYWLYAGERAVVHLYEAEPGEARSTHADHTLDHFAFACTDLAAVEATLAQRGIAHVRANFSRELMCARTLEVYRELLAEMPVAPPGIAAAGGQVAA